jgi:hypothetical protein
MSGASPHFDPSYTHEELVVHCLDRDLARADVSAEDEEAMRSFRVR